MQDDATHARQDLAAEVAASLVSDIGYLASPPDVCVRVFELIESPRTSAREIGEVIGHDPALTARLLKLVNSSFFNFSRRIDTVSRAVAVLGIRELFALVIAVSAIKSFSRLSCELVNIDTFWRHGIFTGLMARKLAEQHHVLHPERLFVAGLLHDIGALALYTRMPEVMGRLLLLADGDEALLHQAELAELGFSHADLGGALAEGWHLPPQLCNAICQHHTPGHAGDAPLEAAIVHLAEHLANGSGLGGYCESARAEVGVDAAAWAALDLDPEGFDAEEIVGAAGNQFQETAALLLASG